MGDATSKRTEKKTIPQGAPCTPSNQGKWWERTYQVCRKSPDGSLRVIASCLTLEEADRKAKSLHKFSGEQHHVYNAVTQQFFVRKDEHKNTSGFEINNLKTKRP